MNRRLLCCCSMLSLLLAFRANALDLMSFAGKILLTDGTAPAGAQVKVKIDLNRNGRFEGIEQIATSVTESGDYNVTFGLDPNKVGLSEIAYVTDLLSQYQKEGFRSLVGNGPIPVTIQIEKEGYTTIVKRLDAMLGDVNFNATLAALGQVGCTVLGCRSPSGDVTITGFPAGLKIDHAYATAFDPATQPARFPGSFADSADNLLISSGFMEIEFRDKNGQRVTTVPSPVVVSYRLEKPSWSTIVDLTPGTDKVEVPMYSFDAVNAVWVSEANGVLVDAAGVTINESKVGDIQAGSYPGEVFVQFSTSHFSSWNVDRPVATHACIKGRVVDENGAPKVGAQVAVQGVSYSGWATQFTVGADGFFAADVMKSELPDEDTDGNGKKGETASFKLAVTTTGGALESETFTSPTAQGSVGGKRVTACLPADCPCTELPDTVVVVLPPRACGLTLSAQFSGKSSQGTSPIAAGAAMARVHITAELMNSVSGILGPTNSICQGQPCGAATTDDSGEARLVVPVFGNNIPRIRLSARYGITEGDVRHDYSGELTVDGCAAAQAELAARPALALDHVELTGVAAHMASIKPPPQNNYDGYTTGPRACNCSLSRHGTSRFALAAYGAAPFLLIWRLARRRVGHRRPG